ncbi:MAG: hypothetical protein JRC92_10895, partial [Deltaproteobacteria bacterium]|nr:hypothetical protein [Deltaproteobacteria bacterium]
MRSYSRSSLGIIGGNVVYGALGLGQAMVVAAVYGAGREYDLYLIAQTAPELWNYLLAGLLQSAFLPAFLRLTTRLGPEEGWRLRWASLGFVLAVSAGLLIVVGHPVEAGLLGQAAEAGVDGLGEGEAEDPDSGNNGQK